jgi:hypothetical protein
MQILLSSCVLQRNMNFDASMHFPIKINTIGQCILQRANNRKIVLNYAKYIFDKVIGTLFIYLKSHLCASLHII